MILKEMKNLYFLVGWSVEGHDLVVYLVVEYLVTLGPISRAAGTPKNIYIIS
jgi:hypothetical protein